MDDADSRVTNPTVPANAVTSGLNDGTPTGDQPSGIPVPIEIERRFLINNPEAIILSQTSHIQQWYLPKEAVTRDDKQILLLGIAVAVIQSEAWLAAFDSILDSDNPTVRIRLTDKQAILCMKGRPSMMKNVQESQVREGDGELRIGRGIDGAGVGASGDEGTGVGRIGRVEMEWKLDLEMAKSLLNSNEWPAIEKSRYFVPSGGDLTWEVDQFLGRHEGLWIAEIELNKEDEKFEFPNWLGKEVTGDFQYSNQYLASN